MDKEDITKILKFAKIKFLKVDRALLDINAHERSITHKFAEFIQLAINSDQKFEGLEIRVDCEYNRYGDDNKEVDEIIKIIGSEETTYNTSPKTVFPDIVVHKRGKAGPNYIVIEAKKSTNQGKSQSDIKKLKKIKERYKYQFAIFLIFGTDTKTIKWDFI